MKNQITSKYYVETWICGNKTNVIDELYALLYSKSSGNKIQYNFIIEEFIKYDKDIALQIINRLTDKKIKTIS